MSAIKVKRISVLKWGSQPVEIAPVEQNILLDTVGVEGTECVSAVLEDMCSLYSVQNSVTLIRPSWKTYRASCRQARQGMG